MNAQHVKQYKHSAVFVCLIWLFGDNFSFPTEESFFLSDDLNGNSYTRILFSGPKAKIQTPCNVHALYLSGWVDFSLF